MIAGQSVDFSEQQLMDCSWGYGANKACDGGDYDLAMDYLIEAGGVATDADYEYLGQDGYCKFKQGNEHKVQFKVRNTKLPDDVGGVATDADYECLGQGRLLQVQARQ